MKIIDELSRLLKAQDLNLRELYECDISLERKEELRENIKKLQVRIHNLDLMR